MMPRSRREFLLTSLAAVAALPGCDRTPKDEPPPKGKRDKELPFDERLSRARQRGADFLLKQQSKDGAWRSDVYGHFKDGTALTPLALSALVATVPERKEAIHKAAARLAGMVKPSGEITAPSYGFDFALYTAALTVTALSRLGDRKYRPARDAFLKMLWQRQLTEDLGWKPDDKEYGGWGYSRDLPRNPKPGELRPNLVESNLSATTFALEAVRAAGVPAKDPRLAKALVFVRRCQNLEDDPRKREPALDDGGFFFIYDDAVRNKAGVAGKDKAGRDRYASYGSVTADGLRCLVYCGLPETDARRRAAHAWLRKHFQAAETPGKYEQRRERDRMGVYFYYTASVAKSPLAAEKVGGVTVRRLLAEALLKQQEQDGSWLNRTEAQRENDPIVATSFALMALA
jgi:squalene-hopene/tetraprenyl-beta-curcumene cyclase